MIKATRAVPLEPRLLNEILYSMSRYSKHVTIFRSSHSQLYLILLLLEFTQNPTMLPLKSVILPMFTMMLSQNSA